LRQLKAAAMPIHIGEIQTDVQVPSADAPTSAPAPEPPLWQLLAQLRALQQQLLSDEQRTAACGNHD
jgi:hypothetical protein